MVGAIACSPADAAIQEAVVGSAQRVVVACARGLDVMQPYSIVSSTSALSIRILSSRGALGRLSVGGCTSGAAPCAVYAPVDLDGQAGIVVDVPPEIYELVRLVIHLASCLYAEYGGGLRHSLPA